MWQPFDEQVAQVGSVCFCNTQIRYRNGHGGGLKRAPAPPAWPTQKTKLSLRSAFYISKRLKNIYIIYKGLIQPKDSKGKSKEKGSKPKVAILSKLVNPWDQAVSGPHVFNIIVPKGVYECPFFSMDAVKCGRQSQQESAKHDAPITKSYQSQCIPTQAPRIGREA